MIAIVELFSIQVFVCLIASIRAKEVINLKNINHTSDLEKWFGFEPAYSY